MAITMRQIAEHLKLSQATVSRVLSGVESPFISEATRARVRQAAEELGYKMNPLARSLATGRTHTVAVWLRNPDAPFYARVLRALAEQIQSGGYELILSGLSVQPRVVEGAGESGTIGPARSAVAADLAQHRRASLSWPVDAVLCVDSAEAAAELLAAQRDPASGPRRPAPVIVVGSDPIDGCDFVGCDHAAGFREAAAHLRSAGRRRVAHVTSDLAIRSVAQSRERACAQALGEQRGGVEVIRLPDETRAAARAIVSERFARPDRPDALLCVNDDVAIGAYRGLRDLGLRIPEDVALVGCDDIEDALYLDPELATIAQPIDDMAREAWRLLTQRLKNPQAPAEHVVLPATFRPRASAG
jgi:LacI family transcriptional regulator